MKAYTDLEQSKKLAEFLPLESADMVLLHEEPYETSDSKFDGLHQVLCVPFNKYDKSWRQKYKNISYFPCWSLAALLGVLPKEINALGTIYSINIHTKNEKWFIDYKCNNEEFVGAYSNIFLDACYEMILKLHELNLL